MSNNFKVKALAVMLGLFVGSAHAYEGSYMGAFSVSPMGAAQYSVPLQVPVGINGMQPQLALAYNSAGGEDIAGYGWSLSGMSSILPCPKMSVIGQKSSTNDGFCLNGQALVVISGQYGAAGSEYRSELDSFSKIVATGGNGSVPDTFTVWNKAGIQSIYQKQTQKTQWLLDKVQDRAGNYMQYTYLWESVQGVFLPQNISYNKNASFTVNVPVPLTVSFSYKDTNTYPDSGSTSSAGPVKRLAAVAMSGAPLSFNDGQQEDINNSRKTYLFAYGYANTGSPNNLSKGLPRLASIVVCDGLVAVVNPVTCSTPTSIVWNDAGAPRVSGINNTYGANLAITYQSLLNSSVYKMQSVPAQEPVWVMIGGTPLTKVFKTIPADSAYYQIKQPDMYVVSDVTEEDGLGGAGVKTIYRYTNLRSHNVVLSKTSIKPGRGAATFEKIEAINQVARSKVVTSYAYVFPYSGFIQSQQSSICLGTAVLDFNSICDLVTQTTNEFDKKTSGQVVFPYIRKTTTVQYDLPSGI